MVKWKLSETKWKNWLGGTIGALVAGAAIMLGGVVVGNTAISQLVGLAVAQSSTLWNNVKDASVGDNLTNGILMTSIGLFDGTNFDRVRGTGGSMNVTPTGAVTPADAYVNPTTASQSWSLSGVFNGTTWDRQRSATADTMVSTGMTAVGNMVFNGATWDRMRGSITNGVLTEKKTVGTAFFSVKRDNIAAASVNLAYGFTSRKISIEAATTNTDEVCIDWLGSTAVCPAANTAGDGRLVPGGVILLDDFANTSISVIAASGTQTVFVRAWQ